MTVIKVFDKNDTFVCDIDVNSENSYNKILKRKKSILDILLDNKVDVYYGCMGGSCSACVCEIKSGLEFIDKEGLHEMIYKMIGPDDVLTCIATIKDVDNDNVIEVKLKL